MYNSVPINDHDWSVSFFGCIQRL